MRYDNFELTVGQNVFSCFNLKVSALINNISEFSVVKIRALYVQLPVIFIQIMMYLVKTFNITLCLTRNRFNVCQNILLACLLCILTRMSRCLDKIPIFVIYSIKCYVSGG